MAVILRRQYSALGLFFVALALTACSPPAPLIEPLPPSSAQHTGSTRQSVTFEHGSRQHQLQVVTQIGPSSLILVGLSPIGQRLFTLKSTNDNVSLTLPVSDSAGLDPKRVISDIQLAYWPLKPLRHALSSNLCLEKQANTRLIWQGDQLIWLAIRGTGDRWQVPVTIYNQRLNYELHVEPATTPADD